MLSRGPNPIWFFNNLTGQVVDDTYYAFFLMNTLPYLPLTVYQDPNGNSAWSNPIEFQPSGGLPDNIYFQEGIAYRIEIRQGPDQTYPLIGNPVENYIIGTSSSGTSSTLSVAQNLITNPQFADVNFITPLTYTQASPGTYTLNVAPGWQLVLTGAGTTILTQGTIAGNSNTAGNPTYYLAVNNSGWTSAQLIQTFNNNGAIFANGAIAVYFLGEAVSSTQNVTVTYMPNGPSNSQNISTFAVTTGGFNPYFFAVDVNASMNNNTDGDANVQIAFVLPASGVVNLTNIQIVGQSAPLPSNFSQSSVPPFQEISYERVVDQEFHYYKQPLAYKPIPSYLVGWDFPLNPAQFLGRMISAQAVGANKSYYAWDQTILFQSANSGITVGSGPPNTLGLNAATTTQMAVIQYLDQIQARKLLNDVISCNLSALASLTTSIKVTISLWYTTDGSLPSTVGSNNSLVATLDANGKPATFNGNWTEVPPLNGQDAICTVTTNSVNGNYHDYPFNGYWNIQGLHLTTITYFAIVVGTESMATGDILTINSISLMNGSIATRPAPQTEDEVLRACQYYYEQSYEPGTIPGSTTSVSMQTTLKTPIIGGSSPNYTEILYGASIEINYKTTKNTVPTVTLYAPNTGDSANVEGIVGIYGNTQQQDIAISNWTVTNSSTDNVIYQPNTASSLFTASITSTPAPYGYEGAFRYQYVADARLGQ